MAEQNIHQIELDNGLILIGEEMPWLESAAFSINVANGCIYDPADKIGLSNFTCEMIQRGCGQMNSREFLERLEWLGVSDSSSVNIFHSHYAGAMPASAMHEALTVFADMLRRPLLPEDQLEDGRLFCLQEIRGIEDDLSQKAMLELRKRFLGDPFGRSSVGTMESVSAISIDDIRTCFEKTYRPNNLILSVAGKIDWNELCKHVESILGDWNPIDCEPSARIEPEHGIHHIPFESQQTQITFACPSIPYSNEDYFLARAAVGALSGGFGSRLFTEVREKRALCYAVSASLHSLTDRGYVMGYAGTAADRAQETLDVTLSEMNRIGDGIDEDELRRVKVAIRSALVMQQESSRARASANAGDWFLLGRIRGREEINNIVQGLTVAQINDYLKQNPFKDFDLVTLGPEPLEYRGGVSTATA